MPLLCLSITVACPVQGLVFSPGERSWLCKRGSAVSVPAWLTGVGHISPGLWSSNSTDLQETAPRPPAPPPHHHFYSRITMFSYSNVCCSQLLTDQASSVCFSSFLPFSLLFLFPSCLLLFFIFIKYTHLNIMVSISTSKHRNFSFPGNDSYPHSVMVT